MAHKSPLEVVNDTFGGKDKLVDKLVGLLESDEPKEDLRKRLLAVANSKLVRLHGVASVVKEKFGSREKMLETVVGSAGRSKDKDYRTRLDTYTTPRLLDAARMAERRSKAASAPAKARAPKAVKTATAKPTGKKTTKAAAKPAPKSTAKGGAKASSKTAG